MILLRIRCVSNALAPSLPVSRATGKVLACLTNLEQLATITMLEPWLVEQVSAIVVDIDRLDHLAILVEQA